MIGWRKAALSAMVEYADAAGTRRASGELEAAVLAVLQDACGAQARAEALSPAEVRERIGGDLAYTTVVTILSRLHGKGVLQRHKDGRAYRYAPVADQPGLAARRMAHVLDSEPDRETVLARFVSALSGRDEDLLRRMLGETETETESETETETESETETETLDEPCPGPAG